MKFSKLKFRAKAGRRVPSFFFVFDLRGSKEKVKNGKRFLRSLEQLANFDLSI